MIQKSVFIISVGYFILCYFGVVVLFLLPLPLGRKENKEHYLPFMLRNLPFACITVLSGTVQLYYSFGYSYILCMLIAMPILTGYLLVRFLKTIFE